MNQLQNLFYNHFLKHSTSHTFLINEIVCNNSISNFDGVIFDYNDIGL
jgi:hypothetical protein